MFEIPVRCLVILLAGAAPGSSSVALHKSRAATVESGAPRAVVPYTTFDFGDVYTGEVISQIFVIKNEGDGELQIKNFKGDCGCTITRSASVIPSGQEATAELEVRTVSLFGPITKSATMHTNDPNQPTIAFTLVANVLRGAPLRQGRYIGPVFLSPDSRGALYASAGKKSQIEFLVTADGTPVKLLSVTGGTKYFAPRVEEVEPGRSYKILVESLQNDAGGLYTDRLRIVTDSPTLRAFTIDLTLQVYNRQ